VGYCSAVTPNGWRWIVDARKGDARRCIVESDELLSAFLELEAMVAVGPPSTISYFNLQGPIGGGACGFAARLPRIS